MIAQIKATTRLTVRMLFRHRLITHKSVPTEDHLAATIHCANSCTFLCKRVVLDHDPSVKHLGRAS